jgi:hypothetical protein
LLAYASNYASAMRALSTAVVQSVAFRRVAKKRRAETLLAAPLARLLQCMLFVCCCCCCCYFVYATVVVNVVVVVVNVGCYLALIDERLFAQLSSALPDDASTHHTWRRLRAACAGVTSLDVLLHGVRCYYYLSLLLLLLLLLLSLFFCSLLIYVVNCFGCW